MSLATTAFKKVEKKLPKVIDARAHGFIDYAHAAFFLGMALFLRRRQPRAAWAAAATGGFILAESLLTDYPFGAARVIPFAVHGRMDAGFAVASLRMPKIFGFEGTPAAAIFLGNGAVEGAVVGLTDWNSRRAHLQKAA